MSPLLENFLKMFPECCKIEHLRNVKKTCIQKYGADNPLKSKEICERAKQTNLEKYGGG